MTQSKMQYLGAISYKSLEQASAKASFTKWKRALEREKFL